MNESPHRESAIEVEVANRQRLPVDEPALAAALAAVLEAEGVSAGTVSLAIVDDREMQELNRQYLAHDWPTDVLSFSLGDDDGPLEGEIIVSAETAVAAAKRYGWKTADELLLYVIHGALHLAGCDDSTPAARQEMRRCERDHLARYGLVPRYDNEEVSAEAAADTSARGDRP